MRIRVALPIAGVVALCTALLVSCATRPELPKGGNLSTMPEILDHAYYDNGISYPDRGEGSPIAKVIE